jgi:hypothetical protein
MALASRTSLAGLFCAAHLIARSVEVTLPSIRFRKT